MYCVTVKRKRNFFRGKEGTRRRTTDESVARGGEGGQRCAVERIFLILYYTYIGDGQSARFRYGRKFVSTTMTTVLLTTIIFVLPTTGEVHTNKFSWCASLLFYRSIYNTFIRPSITVVRPRLVECRRSGVRRRRRNYK